MATEENLIIDRIGVRQQISVKVNLQIQPSSDGSQPLTICGCSRDISIGGICVLLDEEYRHHPNLNDIIKDADVQISFPSADFTVSVAGKIIWNKQIDVDQDTALALGIKFHEMSPKSRGMLLGFAESLNTKYTQRDN